MTKNCTKCKSRLYYTCKIDKTVVTNNTHTYSHTHSPFKCGNTPRNTQNYRKKERALVSFVWSFLNKVETAPDKLVLFHEYFSVLCNMIKKASIIAGIYGHKSNNHSPAVITNSSNHGRSTKKARNSSNSMNAINLFGFELNVSLCVCVCCICAISWARALFCSINDDYVRIKVKCIVFEVCALQIMHFEAHSGRSIHRQSSCEHDPPWKSQSKSEGLYKHFLFDNEKKQKKTRSWQQEQQQLSNQRTKPT